MLIQQLFKLCGGLHFKPFCLHLNSLYRQLSLTSLTCVPLSFARFVFFSSPSELGTWWLLWSFITHDEDEDIIVFALITFGNTVRVQTGVM